MPHGEPVWTTGEEIVALFYKSRKVHPRHIVLIIKYFCHYHHPEQAINVKIGYIRSRELDKGRPDLYFGVHDFEIDAVDVYLWRQVDEGKFTKRDLLEVTSLTTRLEGILKDVSVDEDPFEMHRS